MVALLPPRDISPKGHHGIPVFTCSNTNEAQRRDWLTAGNAAVHSSRKDAKPVAVDEQSGGQIIGPDRHLLQHDHVGQHYKTGMVEGSCSSSFATERK